MATTGDDIIWDDLSITGVQTLEGHIANVPFAVYRPMLPRIVIGSEGGTILVTAWDCALHLEHCSSQVGRSGDLLSAAKNQLGGRSG